MGAKSDFELNGTEVSILEEMRTEARRLRDVEVDRRARAILLIGRDGYTRAEAAEMCEASIRSVFGWQRWYIDGGPDALYSMPIPGKPRRLTGEQLKELATVVEAGPMAAGFDTGVWTAPLIGSWIRQTFQVEYSASQVRRIMHDLGFSLQYPKKNSPRRI